MQLVGRKGRGGSERGAIGIYFPVVGLHIILVAPCVLLDHPLTSLPGRTDDVMYGVGCSALLSNHLPFESWSLLLLPDKVLHYSTESALFAKFIPARHAVVEVSVLTRHKASEKGIKEVPCLCVCANIEQRSF